MKKLFIKSFGCQMNEHDAEQMAGILLKEGYALTQKQDEADMIIMNTCSIRDKAEQKAYSEFGKLDGLKKANPDLIIGFTGCVAQQEGRKILQRISNVDIVMGPRDISHLPDLIQRAVKKERVVSTSDNAPIAPSRPSSRKDEFKAWITIMEGCDFGCSYCVVPTTRGSERSRPGREIFHEIEGLAGEGFREITLLGQTVNAYGRNLGEIIDFPDLLGILQTVPGIDRIRFMTSHPNHVTPKLIDVMSKHQKVCKHIHLPVQSGSNRVLERMNRGYSREAYLEKIILLREAMPALSITTDIITGFPGESEEHFKETLSILALVEFDAIFAFKYSDRPNTTAPAMEGKIPEDEKSLRLAQVLECQQSISLRKNRGLIGTAQTLLVEGAGKNDPQRWFGRTDCNRMVHFNAPGNLKGKMVSVRITDGRMASLEGEMV